MGRSGALPEDVDGRFELLDLLELLEELGIFYTRRGVATPILAKETRGARRQDLFRPHRLVAPDNGNFCVELELSGKYSLEYWSNWRNLRNWSFCLDCYSYCFSLGRLEKLELLEFL